MPLFEKQLTLPVPAEQAFAYLTHPLAFNRLNPPWERVTITRKTGGVEDGAELDMRVSLAPGVQVRWLAVHEGFVPGVQFMDRQTIGPFAHWLHTHRVNPVTERSCCLLDHIQYALPLDWATGLLGYPLVKQKLTTMFAYRHHLMALDMLLPATSLKILVSQHVPYRVPLIHLLAINGATVCQYADEQPVKALLAHNELPGQNLRHTTCLHENNLPALPNGFAKALTESKAALKSGWETQMAVYQAYWALVNTA
jgi:ligand-binding SRPBCC domain-containing protein